MKIGITSEIKISGTTSEEVKTFKYLGSMISDEGSKPQIVARIV